MPEWTEQQRDAIEDRGHSLIVCAAAGSGKTAVLTERITRLVAEGTALTDMLIVTFTKAAASEMRSRIAESLRRAAAEAEGEARAWLAEQSMSVGRAQISTLHSFCGRLLREHFEALTIDPSFRVADEQECAVLKESAMNDALYGCYEAGSEAFLTADARFGEAEMAPMARKLRTFAQTQPSPEAFYARALRSLSGTDAEILSLPGVAELTGAGLARLPALTALADSILMECGEALPPSYVKAATADAALLHALGDAARDGWRGVHAFLTASMPEGKLTWARLGPAGKNSDKGLMEEIKARREVLKAGTTEALSLYWTAPEDAAGDIRETAKPLAGLIELAETWGALYTAAKRRRGVLDFDDLEREALRALQTEGTGIREALAQQYRYVFVDEYQDSSEVQEAILSAFANLGRSDGLFQVGDVKQSIYRFRRAEPSLFRDKAAAYAKPENGWARRIDLNANFRSRANVLAAVNAVFEVLMRADETEIEYDEREHLYPGLPVREDDPPVELHVMHQTDDQALSPEERAERERQREAEESDEIREARGLECEALLAAQRMKALHGTPLYDGKLGETRPMRWRDMAVLMRKVSKNAARVSEILAAQGIPVFCDVGQAYFEIPEVDQTIAILKAVDNGSNDIALLSALRGPALGFSDSDLAEIRIRGGKKVSFHEAVRLAEAGEDDLAARLREAHQKLDFWRLCARHQGVDRLIGRIFAESRLPLLAAAQPDGAGRLANLHLLESRARGFMANQGGSLHAFLAYVARLKSGGDNASASALGENEDVVRVMSIHKSKGLEFPAVFVLGLGAKLTGKDEREPLLLDAQLGAALPCVDTALNTRRTTLLEQAIAARAARAARAEEIRVLYVAMTRARDRLILIGSAPKKLPERWSAGTGPETLSGIQTGLDMLCPLLMSAGVDFHADQEAVTGQARWQVCMHDPELYALAMNSDDPAERLARMLRQEPDPAISRLLRFRPEAEESVRKTSVSAVLRDEKFRQEAAEDLPRSTELAQRPRFMMEKKLTGAEIGTAFHREACAADLDSLRAAPDPAAEAAAQAESMLARGVITQAEARAVPPRMLAALYGSPLGRRILASGRVEREWAFTWRRKGEQEQILQGVIDCCFLEDGHWVLVDYKTDAPKDIRAVLDRHRPQLALYQEALEALTGIPVAERLLWLVRAGRAYQI